MILTGTVETDDRKQTVSEASKAVYAMSGPGDDMTLVRDQLEGCPDTDRAASGI
jgi:hypothetical protein